MAFESLVSGVRSLLFYDLTRIGSDGHESYYTNEFLAKSALKNRFVIRQGLAK